MSCYKCGGIGHKKFECPSNKNKENRIKKSRESGVREGKIKCYDCHLMVADLKMHRVECRNSRFAKSVIKSVQNQVVQREVARRDIVRPEQGHDFYFLLDVSSSMLGSRLNQAKTTLSKIVNQILAPTDRMAIVSFDTNAYFKLKPRPVGQIKRQNELGGILNRIFAKGLTAIWDAIWLAVSEIRNKEIKTTVVVLTDGQDNSSKHSYLEVCDLIERYPKLTLDIIHIGGQNTVEIPEYRNLTQKKKGQYLIIKETEIEVQILTIVKERFRFQEPK